MRARSGARLLLLLRLLPATLALGVVLALCVPSYLRLEPQSSSERIGPACLLLALLGAAGWSISMVRTRRAIVASLRFDRAWRQMGCETPLTGESSQAVVIEKSAPLLALAGVFRPHLVISRGVLQTLSREQLDAALQHENAHRDSRDNLKRLLLLLMPEVFPFVRGSALLEQKWAEFSEWAADDEAVQGDSNRALSLAAALLRVARMGAGPRLSYLHTSFVASDHDLAARVERLLHLEPLPATPHSHRWLLAIGTGLCMAVCALALGTGLTALSSVHQLLEVFLR